MVIDGENSHVWSMVDPGCLGREQCIFVHLLHLQAWFGRDRGRSSHFLRVLAHMRMGEARLSGHNLESGVGHC